MELGWRNTGGFESLKSRFDAVMGKERLPGGEGGV
jgi:hypothetical protein